MTQKLPMAACIGTIKSRWTVLYQKEFNIDSLSGFDYDDVCKELRF